MGQPWSSANTATGLSGYRIVGSCWQTASYLTNRAVLMCPDRGRPVTDSDLWFTAA